MRSRVLPRFVAALFRYVESGGGYPRNGLGTLGDGMPGSSGVVPGREFVWWTRVASNFHSLARRGPRLQPASSSAVDSEHGGYDPTEARTPPSPQILRLVDEIANLSLLEVSDLTSLLKRKLGLMDMPMMPVGFGGMIPAHGRGTPASAPVEKKVPEQTVFDVKLEKFDSPAKIKIIKEVRTFTALGLKEAKELVEKMPAVLKKGVSKEEATQIIEKIKFAGGTAIME